ncbi:hepn domain protein [Treponema primitia ZAS-2]|uniref:Hepn domain protein n=1 Tax=Treponema primitia (strain ATCC BAA-887 / DSM 12427 / ZAS-2) TaxID=545694 RepID=F5YJ08_TREPZ|nr:HEPN domain-containing protein [Treponema primitia]AEF84152.1 hepn domain protein [Treponema primitia ZAS-2]
MNLKDTIQWFYKAAEDYDAAKILNSALKKHNEIICYLCSQATEKYLKGYLVYNDHEIENTHNLPYLNNLCLQYDNCFNDIKDECSLLNKFNNNIRYPDGIEANSNDVNLSFKALENIINLEALKKLEQIIQNQNTEKVFEQRRKNNP